MTLRRMPLLELTTDAQKVLTLGPEWEELRRDSTARGPFMTWPWIGAWLETLGAGVDLNLVTARDPDTDRLIGIAPFYLADSRPAGIPLRALRVFGSGIAAPDHLDLMIRHDAHPEMASTLWNAVTARQRWHLLDLDGVVAGGHLAGVALRRRSDRAIPLPCPTLHLDGGWDVVRERFDGRLLNNLQRYGRKLDRDTDLATRMVADPVDLDSTFDALVRFHQAIRTSKGDAGVFAQGSVEQFLRSAAHRFLASGRLRMWRLDADGRPIAIIMCIRTDDTVAFYTTGYDPAWAKYGVGRQVMARAIRGAIDEGATEFDFLRGDEPYKRSWGAVARDDLVIRRPTTGRGRLVGSMRAARRIIRRGLPGTR